MAVPAEILQVGVSSLLNHHHEKDYRGPYLLLDGEVMREKAARFFSAMPRVRPHFAVKSNPDKRILGLLHENSVGFEIASRAELEDLLSIGVDAAQVFYSNPIKGRDHLAYAIEQGVEWFVCDSLEEMEKILALKSDARLYLRVRTSNSGSNWPLAGKFGAADEQIDEFINLAVSRNADLCGVTFHVGSQCTRISSWVDGIKKAKAVLAKMQQAGLRPALLNIGGGFPVALQEPVPTIEQIGQAVNRELEDLADHIRVIAEPGRYLVSDAGYFICRVIGTATRDGKPWAYLDAGFYSGLMELTDSFGYRVFSSREGALTEWTLAGPTCDSVDVCCRQQKLPVNLREGDFLFIEHAGAYSVSCATAFNGFDLPYLRLIDSN